MDEELFGDRGRALEDHFFRNQDREILEKMRGEAERDQALSALGEATGVTNPEVLEQLLGQGLSAATLAALSLAPLAAVAWADAKLEGREGEAIRREAAAAGIAEGTPGRILLESWLVGPPEPSLLQAWEDYVRDLVPRLSPEVRARLESETLARARAVAAAAGGYLGMGNRTSSEEQAILARIAAAYRQR